MTSQELKERLLRTALERGDVPETAVTMFLALERQVVELKARIELLEHSES